MADHDHTGLLGGVAGVTLARFWTLCEEELFKVVNCKVEFELLAHDLQVWKALFGKFNRASNMSSQAWVNWRAGCNLWLRDTQALVEKGKRVGLNPAERWKLASDIQLQRKSLKDLRKEVPLLQLHLSISPALHVHGYREQIIPQELVNVDQNLLHQLMDMIFEDSGKWLGVWGPFGSGKTLVAKLVNNMACNWFEGRVYFIVVSDAATEQQLLNKLCRLVGCAYDPNDHIEETRSALYTALHSDKALLILDDVWKASFLDLLDVVHESNGSKVFVTTRHKDVLDHKQAREFRMGLLSNEASMQLFCNHAFGVGEQCPKDLRAPANNLVKTCKRLPLALKLVGSAMSSKRRQPQIWELAVKELKDKKVVEKGMTDCFEYSYNSLLHLNKGRVIQECFLTMVSYEEDQEIRFEDLVAWWRGEDLISCLYEHGWAEAMDILDTLVNRSLIEAAHVSEVEVRKCTFHIHSVVRKLALNYLKKGDAELKEHERGCLFVTSWEEDYENMVHNLRKFSLRTPAGGTTTSLRRQIEEVANLPFLQTIVVEQQCEQALVEKIISKSTNLKVLFLPGFNRIKNLESRSQKLQTLRTSSRGITSLLQFDSLRYLEVKDGSETEETEESNLSIIHTLSNLEVLILQDVAFSKMNNFSLSSEDKLISLTIRHRDVHLDICRAVNMRFLELKQVGEMEAPTFFSFRKLETVYLDKVADVNKCIRMIRSSTALKYLEVRCTGSQELEEFPRMPMLRDLTLSGIKSLPTSFFSKVTSLEKLVLLDCNLTVLPEFDRTALPPLQELKFETCGERLSHLPHSITLLSTLAHVDLSGVENFIKESEGKGEAHFQGLICLRISHMQMDHIPGVVMRSSSLRELQLDTFKQLSEEAQYLTSLTQLTIGSVLELPPVNPNNLLQLHYIPNLKQLTLGLDLDGPLPTSFFGGFPCLEQASLKLGTIQQLPEFGLGALAKLRGLELIADSLLHLPLSITTLTSLETLYIEGKCMRSFFATGHNTACKFKSLRYLYIRSCDKIKCLPGVVARSPCLEVITLLNCRNMTKLVSEEHAVEGLFKSLRSIHIQGTTALTLDEFPTFLRNKIAEIVR